ncbi:nucleoside triphosphate pyrophosphohydrolase [Reinekea sp.]|jgi:ATP diphosphatase|uniref:nucleoside triphosphate pyrophosphohydrolase n=1 Tax=Reinekea sp. TaxID=1970455 RepID=UPI002A819116|nr:nucleoside triphosphate pyrophosphohydrolase [Reinekea sp.]
MTVHYSYADLQVLMARLRDPADGCPWDIKQTYASIVPHTLEEVYEVIDTIERNDMPHLAEELGDLLFQVVFYAEIASGDGHFSLDDVIHRLVAKLLYRHPHVFPDGTLASRADASVLTESGVNDQWERLKGQRKPSDGRVLDDVPLALPGLLRAKKLQAKAARVGFDWPVIADVLSKADEELAELKEAIDSGVADAIEDELGDLLFVLANVARHTGVDPEQAVRRTNQKFTRRFGHVEQRVRDSDQSWPDFDLKDLDAFWQEAKVLERN